MGVNINQEQLNKFLAKGHTVKASRSVAESIDTQLAKIAAKIPVSNGVNRNAMQTLSKDDPYRSQAERDYATLLDSGDIPDIARWKYEGIGLYLPDWKWFRPDFYIVLTSGDLLCHEIKGRGKYAVTDKGKAKYLDAKRLYPEYRWKMIQRTGDGWQQIM